MPIYEYECQKCRKITEIRHMVDCKVSRKHEGCGGIMKKIISQIGGFIFRGAGFYRNDYPKN